MFIEYLKCVLEGIQKDVLTASYLELARVGIQRVVIKVHAAWDSDTSTTCYPSSMLVWMWIENKKHMKMKSVLLQ